MDLKQLEALIAVVDHGSFSAAADALFTVQSNVSAHIAKLEADVDAALIDRRTKTLTPAGQAVTTRARAILRAIGDISDDLASLEDRVIGEVACGVTPAVGPRLLPDALVTARRRYPEVSVTIVEGQSENLSNQVSTDRIDLAIVTGEIDSRFDSTPLFTEQIVAMASPDHRLAAKDRVGIADLAGAELILPLADNPLRGHVIRAFASAGVEPRVGFDVGSSPLAAAMARAGVGVAIVPAGVEVLLDPSGTWRAPVVDMAPRPVALITRAKWPPRRAVAAFADVVIASARSAAASIPGGRFGGPSRGSEPGS